MSERRFYIREFDEDGFIANVRDGITESEFKARLDQAFRAAFCTLTEEMDWDKVIDIVVSGKEKEQPVRKDGHSRLVYDKETRTIKKESGQPVCLSISEDLPKEQPTDFDETRDEQCYVPELKPGEAKEPRRCLVTKNECGSDTWMKERPCQCAECQAYLKEQEPESQTEGYVKAVHDPYKRVFDIEPPTYVREAWKARMPDHANFIEWHNWADAMQQWFREEPRGK